MRDPAEGTRCANVGRAGATCPGCALLAPYVRAARSRCWVPHPVSSGILAALKYEGWPGVADGMGERM
ncbi:MAG: hypothetical protein ACKORK_04725, partial [Gemmatimonadota bacterium]